MLSKKLQEQRKYLKDKTKNQEGKREALLHSLKTNSKIPHDVRGEAKEILEDIIYGTGEDEIIHPPPKIAVTTSHNPSSFLKSFSKHMSLVFNGSHLMRGRMPAKELSEYCKTQEVTHLIIIHETKGNPSSMQLCRYPNGPTYHFSMFNVKYERRLKSMGEKAFLVLDGLTSEIGRRLKTDLSLCFPKTSEANRLVALVNRGGTIAFRHYAIERRRLEKECEFDMKLFKVVNSTFDVDGRVDFTLKSFMNRTNDDILSERQQSEIS